MSKISRSTVCLVVLAAVAGTAILASGGSRSTTSSIPEPTKTPAQEAAELYDRGLSHRDKAWNLEKKAAAATDDAQRAKLEKKSRKQFQKAVFAFREAVRFEPRHHQAFSGLGYALRRTGAYDDALNAYDQALALAPGYAEAIEYRAEAYLGLNRLDDAKQAYMELFGGAREKADELLEAMKTWIAGHQENPEGVDATALSDFASWVGERAEIAGQTATVSELKNGKW